MAAQHRDLPRFGVQFHPESILTPAGPMILRNFLALAEVGTLSMAGFDPGSHSRALA
jgi:GMP synthase-like glutamine amidotransferase